MIDTQYYTSNIMISFSSALTDEEYIQAGDFLMYDKGDKEILIRLGNNKNHQIRLRPKDIIRAPFKKFYVSGDAGANVYLKIMGSPNDSVRVEPATRVIDQILCDKSPWYGSIKNENSFTCGLSNGSSGGVYAALQLWNPDNSGKLMVLHSIILTPATSGSMGIYTTDSALSTLSTKYFTNSYIGKDSGVIECREEDLPALPSLSDCIITSRFSSYYGGNILSKPLIIPEKTGLIFSDLSTDTGIYLISQWDEIDI